MNPGPPRRRFEDLGRRGQVGRLRMVAARALPDFGLDPAPLPLVATSFNTLFRHGGSPGRRHDHVVRVGPELVVHPAGSGRVEADWLDALRRDTDLAVPRIRRTAGGEPATAVTVAGVPGRRAAAVLSWVPGRAVGARRSAGLARGAGRILAELHDHAAATAPPAPPAVPVADRILYWEDPTLIHLLVPRYGTVFLEAVERSQRALDRLWAAPPHPPHLLHGDLTPANLVDTGDGLVPIDFQDLVWGFEIHDVAIGLLPYQRHPAAAELTGAFRAGYGQVRPWPDADPALLDALWAARRLAMVNLALNLGRPDLGDYVDRTAAGLAGWLRT